jgi:uncharacterized protein YdaU (DUF1376 family)
MRHGSDWYHRYPTDYLGGVQGMTRDEHAVYSIVLELIYQHGGTVNNDPAWFAGWISDMGPAKVRNTIEKLVARGKLHIDGDQITQRRAREQAKTKDQVREKNRDNAAAGGRASADARAKQTENARETDGKRTENARKTDSKHSEVDTFSGSRSNENNALAVATGSPREEKRREEYSGGGGRAPAQVDLTEPRERLLAAIGADPRSGLVGPNGRQLGTEIDMAAARRWATDLGLSLEQQITVINAAMARKTDGPPSSFKYFDKAMARYAGEIASIERERLTPTKSNPSPRRNRHDNTQFHLAHAEYERRIAAGEIDPGADDSDPFAGR